MSCFSYILYCIFFHHHRPSSSVLPPSPIPPLDIPPVASKPHVVLQWLFSQLPVDSSEVLSGHKDGPLHLANENVNSV